VSTSRPWRDAETVRRLYHVEGLSQEDIADRLGCAQRTVSAWMERHGIDTDERAWKRGGDARRVERAHFYTRPDGYEHWTTRVGGRTEAVTVHRLTAVAEYGFDTVADRVVHHINHIPFDNRPENLQVLDDKVHKEGHAEELSRLGAGVFSEKNLAGKGTSSSSSRANLGDPQ